MGKFLVSIKELERWFQQQGRILPWRNLPTFYRVWVSEVMLQQTQVSTVVPYFERFMAAFPSVEKLAAAPEEEVLKLWAGLGYYSRARNLQKGAQKIGKSNLFPKSREGWLEIPGVGNYTAGAILSIADHQPEAILDGNVERVLSRVRRVSRQKGETEFKRRLWRISKIFVETGFKNQISPSVLNQGLMELGATVCTPRNPRCEICPLKKLCRAYEKSEQDQFPPKKKAKNWVQIQETLDCIITDTGLVLVRQRQAGEWRAGLWDLPDSPFSYSKSFASSNFLKYGKLCFLGQVETRHIVTRHKIQRTTKVWKLVLTPKNSAFLQASEPFQDLRLKWVLIRDPEVPVGSALKKTLQKVLENYSEVNESTGQGNLAF